MSLVTFDQHAPITTTIDGPALPVTYVAPKRFDVHTVTSLRDWVEHHQMSTHQPLTIDASDVRFIDVAAIEAIETLASEHPARCLTISSPSMAVALTLEFLRPTSSAAAVA